MPLKKRDVFEKLMNKFGFEAAFETNHEGLCFSHNGKKIATTRFSRKKGGTDIYDDMLKMMAKQIHVETLSYFKEMISCTKSREDYMDRLRENGLLK